MSCVRLPLSLLATLARALSLAGACALALTWRLTLVRLGVAWTSRVGVGRRALLAAPVALAIAFGALAVSVTSIPLAIPIRVIS